MADDTPIVPDTIAIGADGADNVLLGFGVAGNLVTYVLSLDSATKLLAELPVAIEQASQAAQRPKN